jgi:RNA polymerase sigma factor (TIGR02999 family)
VTTVRFFSRLVRFRDTFGRYDAGMPDITQLLDSASSGDRVAAAELLPLVYDELRKLAANRMATEPAGHTLQPTALVHEAYLRLVGGDPSRRWAGRTHFFAAAARAMREILVDHARRRRRARHGGGRLRVELGDGDAVTDPIRDDLLALNEVLVALAAEDPVKAQLVECRYFGGMTEADAANALGISRATAARYWRYARAWLIDRLTEDRPAGEKHTGP